MGFEKIAGYQNEKKQLEMLTRQLLRFSDYEKIGIRLPRGVLLYGVPGVGKTVMARSIKVEGVTLVELRAADCLTRNPSKNILDAFEKARENTPSLLLLDELDKIAESSPNYYMEGNENVMKVLLQELDKSEENRGVLIVATCNQYEYMNPALLRSGRFDKMIKIESPGLEDRTEIIKLYLGRLKMRKNISEEYFAKITGGYTGAQIESVINEAALLAADDEDPELKMAHIQTVMNRMAFKAIEKKVDEGEKLERIAVHEAGHAIVAAVLRPEHLASASVIPHGASGGHIRMLRNEVSDLYGTVDDAENEITVGLAGIAAEKLILNSVSLNCEDDLEKAAAIAYFLTIKIGAYGFDKLINIQNRGEMPSESVKNKVAETKSAIMDKMLNRATEIIRSNLEWYKLIVDKLKNNHVLSEEEIFELKNKLK